MLVEIKREENKMEEEVRFEYYVLNHNFNKNTIEAYNIFRNYWVNDQTAKAVRKYLRAPSKFKYTSWSSHEVTYGFDAFVKELDTIIRCEEWARCEYEIMVNGMFSNEDKAQKIDCYEQCRPNMEMIAREVIYQYKKFLKEKENGKSV